MTHEDPLPGDMTLTAMFRSGGLPDIQEEAAKQFADRYLEQLLSLIERNTSQRMQVCFSPEDVAQSVLASWFIGVRERRITPAEGDQIWPLISVIALNKVRERIRFHQAGKRDVRKVAGNSDLLEQIAQPTERDALEFQDFLELISSRLSPQNLQILQLTMQGWSMNRIAEYLGVVTRTIRRRKQEIREALLPYLPDSLRQQVQDDDPIEHGGRDQH